MTVLSSSELVIHLSCGADAAQQRPAQISRPPNPDLEPSSMEVNYFGTNALKMSQLIVLIKNGRALSCIGDIRNAYFYM